MVLFAAATPAAAQSVTTSADATVPPAGDGGRWRAIGVVTTLAGVALVGAGVAWTLSARNAASEVSERYDPARAEEGERNAKLSWVGYGIGTAMIVTGVVLYARGLAPSPPTTSPSWPQIRA